MTTPDYSKYLISEAPVVFQPTLAAIFGTEEAILLQQIHWFSQHPHDRRVKHRQHDRRIWVQMKPYHILNPIDGHLKFISLRTFRRKITNLKNAGVLMVQALELYDTTNWYAIDYERLGEIEKAWKRDLLGWDNEEEEGVCQTVTPPSATNKNGTAPDAKLSHPPVPNSHQGSDKVAPYKDRELESIEDSERLDRLFESLNAVERATLDDEAQKRLSMLGVLGARPMALQHMRRHLLRERGGKE